MQDTDLGERNTQLGYDLLPFTVPESVLGLPEVRVLVDLPGA